MEETKDRLLLEGDPNSIAHCQHLIHLHITTGVNHKCALRRGRGELRRRRRRGWRTGGIQEEEEEEKEEEGEEEYKEKEAGGRGGAIAIVNACNIG